MAHGGSCVPTCNPGYTLVCSQGGQSVVCAFGNFTSTCQCEPAGCSAAVAPANGAAGSCTSSMAHGGSCVPTCTAGYMLVGVSTNCSYGAASLPNCVPADCSPLSNMANGGVGNCSVSMVHQGGMCLPTCSRRYLPQGRMVCAYGAWGGLTCDEVYYLQGRMQMTGMA